MIEALGNLTDRIIDQGTYTRAYTIGIAEPRYSVPAINILIEVCPPQQSSSTRNSLIIWEISSTMCECCGRYRMVMAAIWDFNWDRCMDFNYMCGVYTNGRQIAEGVNMYAAEQASSYLFEGDGIQ